jgi:hypothetical protein
MRRILPLLVIVAVAGVASADKAADVTALVKKNLDGMAAKDDAAYGKTLAKDALLWDGNGQAFTLDCKDCPSRAFIALYGEGGFFGGSAKHKLGKLTVVVDDAHGVAWFQGPFEATYKSEGGANPCGPPTAGGSSTMQMRVGGIAVDDHGWKIAAIMYTHPMADADLIDKSKAYEVKLSTSNEIAGDKEVSTSILNWFPKLSTAKTSGKVMVASGSAPNEFFEGATVAKIAPEWDKLGLVVSKIDTHVFAGGTIAFVHADTLMPIKKTPYATPLALGAVAVHENGEWKWVSLQFAPGLAPW